MRYDVVVAGGGLSGVTAAISAARGGSKVCLVEQTLTLGGLGTSGMMTVIISPKNFFGGTGREILDRLYGEDALGYGKGKEDYSFMPFQNEAMKRLLDSMVTDEANIDLLLYSKIIGARCENGAVKSISVSAYEGIVEVEANVFIDATGDGTLAVLCGEDYEYGDGSENIQAPTLPSYYVNVDYTKYYNFLKENNYDFIGTVKGLVEKAVDEGVLSAVDYHHPGENRITSDIASMNVGHLYGMPLKSSKDFTAAMIAENITNFIKSIFRDLRTLFVWLRAVFWACVKPVELRVNICSPMPISANTENFPMLLCALRAVHLMTFIPQAALRMITKSTLVNIQRKIFVKTIMLLFRFQRFALQKTTTLWLSDVALAPTAL